MVAKLRQLLIGLAAVAMAVFGFSGISTSIAATSVGGDADTEATTSATAETLPACSWYVTGLAESIALTNGDDMEYVGNDYTLEATDEGITIFFSASDTADQRCSFYDDEKGVTVEVSWAGESFTTGTLDTSMDFAVNDALETSGNVTVDIVYAGECSDDWIAGGTTSIGVDLSPLTPAEITNESVYGNYTPTLKGGAATFASCTLNASYTTKIPGGKTPLNPGTNYSFTGPTLTTTVTIND
jgi:hypothetical protein